MTNNQRRYWSNSAKFWLATFPFEFDARRFALARTEVSQVLSLTELPNQASILDMACGPGRHSLELARRGHQVTGVDLTADYIKMAQENATSAGLNIEYIVADARDFERPRAFDLVLNLFTSFGYFEDESDNLEVLSRAFSSLKPGGQLVIDTVNGPCVASRVTVKDTRRLAATTLDEISVVSPDKRTLHGNWTLTTPGEPTEYFDFILKLYSPDLLSNLLKQAGFRVMKVYGGLSGQPYREDSPRLATVATK